VPSPDWLPAIPLSDEATLESDGKVSNDDENESDTRTNLEQIANSNMILLSGSSKNRLYINKFSRSDSWKKNKTTKL
jgi:hypothetical protein